VHISLEGLPALGRSELLSVLRLYPDQILILPELAKEVAEAGRIHLLRERSRLSDAIGSALPEHQQEVRDALARGMIAVEESHLGVHAAYAAALGDTAFLTQFQEREPDILGSDRFVRLAAPISVSLSRQEARDDPRYAVPADVLGRMFSGLADWHARRGSALALVDADRPPGQILGNLASAVHVCCSSCPWCPLWWALQSPGVLGVLYALCGESRRFR